MPAQTYELNSDAAGNWSLQANATLTPGSHVITAKDADGNQDQATIYVTQAQPSEPEVSFVDRVHNLMPIAFLYAILALICIIIALIINNARVARKANMEIAKTRKSHIFRNAIIFCVVMIFLTAGVGIYVNRQTNIISEFLFPKKTISVAKVSGRLTDPVSMQSVSGVDLVAGDTSIRTISSGQFNFSTVDTNKGIRITYPTLLRALILLPSKELAQQNITLYFNVDLLNLQIKIADLEARQKYADIYDFLPANVQQKINRDKFASSYSPAYNELNLTDQEINIVATQIFDNWRSDTYGLLFNRVVAVTVEANGAKVTYYFTDTPDGWKVIK